MGVAKIRNSARARIRAQICRWPKRGSAGVRVGTALDRELALSDAEGAGINLGKINRSQQCGEVLSRRRGRGTDVPDGGQLDFSSSGGARQCRSETLSRGIAIGRFNKHIYYSRVAACQRGVIASVVHPCTYAGRRELPVLPNLGDLSILYIIMKISRYDRYRRYPDLEWKCPALVQNHVEGAIK